MGVIYVIQGNIDGYKGAIYKIGKASSHSVDRRIKMAKSTIQSDYTIDYDVYTVDVDGDGYWHEQALHTAFKKSIAMVTSHKSVYSEYFTPYYWVDGIRDQYINIPEEGRLLDTLEALSGVAPRGGALMFGHYLTSVLYFSLFNDADKYPCYCQRDENNVRVDLHKPIDKDWLNTLKPITEPKEAVKPRYSGVSSGGYTSYYTGKFANDGD